MYTSVYVWNKERNNRIPQQLQVVMGFYIHIWRWKHLDDNFTQPPFIWQPRDIDGPIKNYYWFIKMFPKVTERNVVQSLNDITSSFYLVIYLTIIIIMECILAAKDLYVVYNCVF